MTKAGHVIHGEVDLADGVYYKLLWTHNNHRNCHVVTVVCMQWFDEHDYDSSKFVRNDEGDVHVFATEELAKAKLNEWFNKEDIDPGYAIFAAPKFVSISFSQEELKTVFRWYNLAGNSSFYEQKDLDLFQKLESYLK